jgi:predicted DsbA family dithiol-disulfide isomerase
MAKSSLDMAQAEVPLQIEWKAFELRPTGSPPMDENYKAMIRSRWEQTKAMAQQYGVVMEHHRFGVNTRLAHRSAKVVERLAPDQVNAYNMALFAAYFEHDLDISQEDVLVQVAEGLGIDGAALRAGLAAGEGREQVFEEQQFARSAQISGVPAFVFMDKYLVTGVRPADQLVAIVNQIQAQEGLA